MKDVFGIEVTNDYLEVNRYMGALLSRLGFVPDGMDSDLEYGGRPAWAVYYRGDDCKLQVCWSARDGGIDFLIAPPDAPNELGIANPSKKWRFLLLASDFDEGLETPALAAGTGAWWAWRSALFEVHFPAARGALMRAENE